MFFEELGRSKQQKVSKIDVWCKLAIIVIGFRVALFNRLSLSHSLSTIHTLHSSLLLHLHTHTHTHAHTHSLTHVLLQDASFNPQ